MRLHTRSWGQKDGEPVFCVHGIGQHGGVFEPLGRRLAELGFRVVAVDLRGHGRSLRQPPWNVETHVADLIDTCNGLGLQVAGWVGHSFGGRLVAALAARAPQRTSRLALLEPGLQVSAEHALQRADIDRLDWSFATVDGAVAALLSADGVIATPHATAMAFAQGDMQRGPDDRLRFGFAPGAVVVAWSEMTLPPPPIARVPTLLLHASAAVLEGPDPEASYREALGPLLTVAEVPNGHNVMWESPQETVAAIESFVTARPLQAAAAPLI
jgi:lipase